MISWLGYGLSFNLSHGSRRYFPCFRQFRQQAKELKFAEELSYLISFIVTNLAVTKVESNWCLDNNSS
ncbi:hypothetical protein ES703_106133 [subsurface metagenome]